MTDRCAYPSDLSDAAWEFIAPLLPAPRSGTAAGGRPPVPLREVVNAILYLDRTGASWRQLPHDFPHWRTVYGYFAAWAADGTLDAVHEALATQCRHADGRHADASAGVIDAQSVHGADTVGAPTRGYDAGKRSTAASATSWSTPWGCCS